MTKPGLAQSTARGVAMLTGATVGGKLVSSVGQIVLAWLLVPEDFGLIALAYTVMSFSRAIEQLGLREILIRKQESFDRWINSTMWLAGLLGLIGGAFCAIAAPIAAIVFDEPRLIPLILILAPASPLLSLAQICEARLEKDMRYGQVTIVHFGVVSSQMVLAIILAFAGAGALSFVIPRTVISLARLVYVWSLVRPRVRRTPQTHRWKPLLKSGAPVMASALLAVGAENVDYVILGLIASSTASLGFYYFAFLQSTQIVWVFSTSLGRVLVPSLSTLKDDPVRQVRAYMRGVGLIGAMIAPLCVMQAAAAGPVLRLLFGDKWAPSIPLLQLLSLSVMFSVISWPIVSLLMAQGRYTMRLLITGISLTLFTGSVALGAYIGEALGSATLGAAIAVLAHRSWYAPVQTWHVVHSTGVRYLDCLWLYARPVLNALVSVGPVWALSDAALPLIIDSPVWLDIARLALIACAAPVAFTLWVRLSQPRLYREMTSRCLGVLPERFAARVPRWLVPRDAPQGSASSTQS